MKKHYVNRVVIILAIISIAIITFIGFSASLKATMHRGIWVTYKGEIVGCGGIGDECDWGTVDPNPVTN